MPTLRKRGAPPGNQNARRAAHTRHVVSVSGPTLDLIYEYLASQGSLEPDKQEIDDAISYAVRQTYGRRMEDQQAIIL